METDKQTKIFITGSDDLAWPMYPHEVTRDQAVRGDAGREIVHRADFICVNSERFEGGKNGRFGKQIGKVYGIYPKNDELGIGTERIVFDRMKFKNEGEEFKELAIFLEKLTNRTGLTILVR